jgi:hypothetical protein
VHGSCLHFAAIKQASGNADHVRRVEQLNDRLESVRRVEPQLLGKLGEKHPLLREHIGYSDRAILAAMLDPYIAAGFERWPLLAALAESDHRCAS